MKKVLSILVLICLCVSLVGCSGKKDNSKLTSEELQTFLEKEGYKFMIDDMDSSVKTHYVVCYNDDIWIQQVDNPITGTMVSFKNEKVNDEFANILDKEENDTKETKTQYDAYLDWLDQNGITKAQLQDVLEYYDDKDSKQEGKSGESVSGNEEAIQTLVELGYVKVKDNTYASPEKDITFKNLGSIEWIQFDFDKNYFVVKAKNEVKTFMFNWNNGEAMVFGDLGTEEDLCVYNVSTKQSTAGSCDASKNIKALNLTTDFYSYLTENKIFITNTSS